MQIPLLNGITADNSADFRTNYPRNLIPVPKATGIANGYLRPGEGIVLFGTGTGIDRGGINWRGQCYRVMGTNLVRVEVNGAVTVLGFIPGADLVVMDYSFDRLAIAANGGLFYWDGSSVVQVTDPDLGVVKDVQWVDGYFMTTDGEFLVVTELNNPLAVDPLKYGSSEVDPDPVMALLKLRNEIYALNRHTIEAFDNVGGENFPFARIDGAQVTKGLIGTHACCLFAGTIAFLGSARNEAPGVYFVNPGEPVKISTREIDLILQDYTEAQLSQVLVEAKADKAHQHLMIHLPDKTLVYDGAASQILQEPVWFTLDSGNGPTKIYRARNHVWCYEKWIVGDPTSANVGYLTDTVSSHYGQVVGWEFGTIILFNEGRGAIVHEMELIGLPGRVALGADPVVWTSYSLDGETWSQERAVSVGKIGQREARVSWRRMGHMKNYRMQKFRGTSDAHFTINRLEARVEPLDG
jgi:hypothetical protein